MVYVQHGESLEPVFGDHYHWHLSGNSNLKNYGPVRKKIPNLFAFLQALKMPSVILINSTSFKIPGKYQQNVFEFLLGLLDYRVHLCK